MTQRRETLRIANCSGFYGDRLSAAREMVEGGPIDVLTGDYLAELTMLLLWKARQRDPEAGYALSFLAQMGDVLGTCLDRGIKIVVNAGGLNPAGLAARLRELAALAGLTPSVAHLEGDDLLDRLPELQREGHPFTHLATGLPLADAGVRPLTANAYLGAWGITEALRAGADVVICGRVTDASLVVGPAAWAFDWATDDWDRLAGAVTAGHIIECGAQATGGNYSFFTEIERPVRPGFPIAELRADGSSVITKHEGTGGAVTVDTVTAQLLYEIDRPAYLNPDVVTRFDTVTLEQQGPDRVLVSGARGEPAPDTLKVCLNHHGGYRNSAAFVLTGPDIEAKARFAEASLLDATGGPSGFGTYDLRTEPTATGARLTLTVKDADKDKVGRALFGAVVGTGLSTAPGLHMEHFSPRPTEYGVHWPALVPAALVHPEVVLQDGTRVAVPRPPATSVRVPAQPPAPPARPVEGPTVRAPLGLLVGARSGDKGGDANVGLWARDDAAYGWLRDWLDVERLRALLPEAAKLPVSRYELPKLRALNFVVHGLLGEGVAASTRPDPQAKGLGEYLRGLETDIPAVLVPGQRHEA
ncbi:acyclic terpene utilization AtuA family protein [Actinacidiphila glaucinigra]|uniref:acyclic terpene utilization AtuA family protein n=1 Tax=Actinacidiphila glaucinigra TaxID=235986 RepID=UPI002E2F6473|nr:acyclic terpene utilization AtuA family protein [Actinacidiphila glaucinigra]